jgi:hypothetical protein
MRINTHKNGTMTLQAIPPKYQWNAAAIVNELMRHSRQFVVYKAKFKRLAELMAQYNADRMATIAQGEELAELAKILGVAINFTHYDQIESIECGTDFPRLTK